MRTVVQGWSSLGFLARVAIPVLTGVAWAARSLQAILLDPDYWDPVTANDYVSIYLYSLAWLLTAASLLILREVARPARDLSVAIVVVAVACVVTGVANGIEDAVGASGFGMVYVIGILTSVIGMIAIAAMLRGTPAGRLAFVPAIGALTMFLMVLGGGILGLAAWGGFAAVLARERWKPSGSPAAA
jgi:hypothetical protein